MRNTIPFTSASTTYRRVTVDDTEIFYREAGPADGPVVVLLHGFPSSSRMYDPLIPLLADTYRVIAPDYPGFGHSSAPSPHRYTYTFDALAGSIDAFLEHLKIERYTLFMQDYGGPIGFRVAIANPGKIEALIIQNANAYQEGLGPKWANIAKFWQDPDAHREQLDGFVSLEGARQRHLGNTPNPERYNPDGWADEFAMISRPGQREIQASLLYDYRTNVEAYPKWQKWMREHTPSTLVLWGRFDPSFIVAGAKAYLRDLPDAELHLLDAGHFALDEAADEVAGLTRDFLARHLDAKGRSKLR
ncbi:alpha/beta hydrolase [bacterium M00.F.Ca.ET.194.01.1.1]|nr:alpha/beta hydrolase [bacterium M00.F.Ca.ET.194.01.1.1]TGS52172.1 alpha/beta hydrolase [bacterium M00.F.Ca.ET.179.01.1.1]TGV43320.1 alpha/beta hydrolase [bacterium M00.F.Ca.ET.168.01.1.1]